MDPDCAICHAPATMACDCEAKRLEVAVKQAEDRMMRSIYSDIRFASPLFLDSFRPTSLIDRTVALGFAHMHRTISSNTSASSQNAGKLPTPLTWIASPPTRTTTITHHLIPTRLPRLKPLSSGASMRTGNLAYNVIPKSWNISLVSWNSLFPQRTNLQ